MKTSKKAITILLACLTAMTVLLTSCGEKKEEKKLIILAENSKTATNLPNISGIYDWEDTVETGEKDTEFEFLGKTYEITYEYTMCIPGFDIDKDYYLINGDNKSTEYVPFYVSKNTQRNGFRINYDFIDNIGDCTGLTNDEIADRVCEKYPELKFSSYEHRRFSEIGDEVSITFYNEFRGIYLSNDALCYVDESGNVHNIAVTDLEKEAKMVAKLEKTDKQKEDFDAFLDREIYNEMPNLKGYKVFDEQIRIYNGKPYVWYDVCVEFENGESALVYPLVPWDF